MKMKKDYPGEVNFFGWAAASTHTQPPPPRRLVPFLRLLQSAKTSLSSSSQTEHETLGRPASLRNPPLRSAMQASARLSSSAAFRKGE